MKKIVSRFIDFILDHLLLIIFFSFVGVIFFYFFGLSAAENRFEIIIGVILLYSGIVYNLVSYKIANDQFFKSLFTEFNSRYDKLNEDLKAIRNNNFNKKNKNKESIIIDYLNLCAEEYFWYKKRRINQKVWASWEKGIEYYLFHDSFVEIVINQLEEKNSYYGFFDFVENNLIVRNYP